MHKDNEILTGNIWKYTFFMAMPIVATNMLQQLFNATDTAVVGRFASSLALAAVGCTGPVVNLCITIMAGLSIGANAVIAQSIGREDKRRIKTAVDSSMMLAVISGLLLCVIGELAAVPLLRVMGTPADVFDFAVSYIRIYFLGMPFLTVYNFEAAILRAGGDTKRPLYCLIFTGILNLALNVLFVVAFRLGVIGVALATTISNVVNAVLLFYFIVKGNDYVRFDHRTMEVSGSEVRSILTIGVPSAVQGMLFNTANMIIQSGFNSLGSDVVAASTIALNIEIFAYYLITGFSQTAVTFNGQNLGAGNLQRCRKATFACLSTGGVLVLLLSMFSIWNAVPFCSLFATQEAVIALAVQRIRLVMIFEIFNLALEVLSGSLRGLGHSILPTVMSAIFVCGTRLVWVFMVFPKWHSFRGLLAVYPVSWILDAAMIGLGYVIVMKKLRAGRSRQI